MKFLLDTHTIIWYLLNSPELSKDARKIIDSEPDCFYSYVSLWEIALKQGSEKLTLKTPTPEIENACQNVGFQKLAVTTQHFETMKALPKIHNDPFDRLLIAQAIENNMRLITKDAKIKLYSAVKTLW